MHPISWYNTESSKNVDSGKPGSSSWDTLIDEDGILVDPDKTITIQKMAAPTNVSELRQSCPDQLHSLSMPLQQRQWYQRMHRHMVWELYYCRRRERCGN
jgi:hypothetical protein